MTGISITVDLDDIVARDRLQDMLDRMDRREPFFKDVGQALTNSVRRRFATETGPDGAPWTALSPRTVRARTRRRRSALSILRERGLLAGSIHYRADNDSVAVGAVPEYAAIHQFGGTINMPARSGTVWFGRKRAGQAGRRFAKKKNKTSEARAVQIGAYTITIPARPYLGISAEDEISIQQAAERWLGL